MVVKNINQEFRLKNINEIRYSFIKETNKNELNSKKHKAVFKTLNYISFIASYCYIKIFVASYFAFYYYISRLGFTLIIAFILLPDTQRIFNLWRLLLFILFFCCIHVCYRKEIILNTYFF